MYYYLNYFSIDAIMTKQEIIAQLQYILEHPATPLTDLQVQAIKEIIALVNKKGLGDFIEIAKWFRTLLSLSDHFRDFTDHH